MSVGEESLGANTMLETSKLYLAQEDGGLATTLAAGSAPGESGVSVLSVRFHRGAHLCAALRRHLICLCRRCALREMPGIRITGVTRFSRLKHHCNPHAVICPSTN